MAGLPSAWLQAFRRRSVLLLVAALVAAMAGTVTTARTANASDCEIGFICGVVYNHGGRTLVAASLDRSGGTCPPYGRCGTCDVPGGSDSTRPACSSVFKDADVFTYDSTGYYLNGTHYSAHQYAKFGSYDQVDCYDYDVSEPNCSTSVG
jgi:hypothetical protein